MKLKATISMPGEDFSLDQRLSLAELVIATNNPSLHEKIYEEVLVGHLRVSARGKEGAFGPNEIYCRIATEQLIPDLCAQLSSRIMLDRQIEYLDRPGFTSLVEKNAILVVGKAQVREVAIDEAEVTMAEWVARFGDRRAVEGMMRMIERGTIERSYRPNPERGN